MRFQKTKISYIFSPTEKGTLIMLLLFKMKNGKRNKESKHKASLQSELIRLYRKHLVP